MNIIRMIDGIDEMVLNGERYYRVMSAPLADKSAIETLFCNTSNYKENGKKVRCWKIREPYYEF
jgi:hypothetical protein